MKLTILGNNGGYPKGNGACSGYLLENEQVQVIFDLGAGTLSNLLSINDGTKLDAVFITHLHWDHISDLFVLQYLLEKRGQVLPLYLPKTPENIYEILSDIKNFDVHPISDGDEVTIKNMKFSFKKMRHPVETYAIKASDERNHSCLYTGDTGVCQALKDFAQDTHTLLCDCTYVDNPDENKHLSAEQAAEIAENAGVRHLILTHFDPQVNPRDYAIIAERILRQGRVTKSEIMLTFNI
ncbi:MBL fold metallo-hydrolase [Pseudoramibacter sp.]|jgi:ribonuclease BN (tRNA processing enzyme)|uniref:MBL fold metallo-hydrolase n=1 Tax=Pseudoramibacter sp. TaxID=2034862 RepID=UPI0025EA7F9E|nr:MBL fold metallo-hydrolase [Pseudoramibacter sp.]MCH4072728.1 MBL fold metallo-hydrolase [Pseudoramibacter sp.]MCH4106499.1 MBL fold metallo-hydrolase [Pseudoramibacter sp.]